MVIWKPSLQAQNILFRGSQIRKAWDAGGETEKIGENLSTEFLRHPQIPGIDPGKVALWQGGPVGLVAFHEKINLL